MKGDALYKDNRSPTQTKPFNPPPLERWDILVQAGYYGSTCHQHAVPISWNPGRMFFTFDMGKLNFSLKGLL